MTRTIHLTLSVEVPDSDEVTDNEVAAALNAALDEPGDWDNSGPYWGEWVVGRLTAFQEA
jgi:hypothetical protein